MKKTDSISQLLLERYHRGKVTEKERKIVETALSSDKDTYNRYEEIKKSDEEIRRMYPLEKLPKLAAIKDIEVPSIIRFSLVKSQGKKPLRYKPILIGICAAAVITIITLFSVLYLLKGRNSVNVPDNAVAQDTQEEVIDNGIDNIEPKVKEDQKPVQKQETTKKEQKPSQKQETKQNPKPINNQEARNPESLAEKKSTPDLEKEGIAIAVAPESDTGAKTRGGNTAQQSKVTGPSEEEANITIPPGLTFIFENMFANKQLSVVIIPGRITSIGKNAFAGNPLISVTLGANVSIADEAFPGNLKDVYNRHGQAAGTYIRPNISSTEWSKQ